MVRMIGILLMEEHLNYNWNVYKIFKNGNRAQAPFMTFEHCESDAEEYFEEEVKKNFTKKLQQAQFMIMRADKPQTTFDDPRKKKFVKSKTRDSKTYERWSQTKTKSVLGPHSVEGVTLEVAMGCVRICNK